MTSHAARCIVLGAGRPYRGDDPSALVATPGNRRVLDWIMDAFAGVVDAEFHFVGGYRVEDVVRRYPLVGFSINPDWRTTGSAGSLFCAPLDPLMTTYVCYADVVFRAAAVLALRDMDADVVIVADAAFRDRYAGRSAADLVDAEKVVLEGTRVVRIDRAVPAPEAHAEFIGLMKVSPSAVARVAELRDRDRRRLAFLGLPELTTELMSLGLSVRAAVIQGDWAELDAPQDLARFVLGTKAETLERLRPLVRRSVIGAQVAFSVAQWRADRGDVLRRIVARFGAAELAVRSSARSEDGWRASLAGSFSSRLGVPCDDSAALDAAVSEVVASYGDDDPSHQVLVQEMVGDVVASGVVLSRTLSRRGPYRVVNYDATTSRTDTVTGGGASPVGTLVVRRGGPRPAGLAEPLSRALDAVEELEDLVGHDSLDMEFAATADGRLHVLQLRPIAADPGQVHVSDAQVASAVESATASFRRLQRPSPGVVGRRTLFGVMPDWNPAEMIGTRPRRLALSLYQMLITDEVWATQRAEFGYRDVRPCPLLVSFAGHPYIDVRASFNSFVPASVGDGLAGRLVEHYVDRLAANPHLHDKVEFDVAFTCLAVDFDQLAASRLAPAGFSVEEIRTLAEGLRAVTAGTATRCADASARVRTFETRHEAFVAADLAPIDRAFALLDDCRRLGTLPFAHLARCAFVAVTLLRSLERVGALEPDELREFFASLSTVAGRLAEDARAVAAGGADRAAFLRRYGHLRPGTYDITSPSYREDPDRYLRPSDAEAATPHAPSREAKRWTAAVRSRVAARLRTAGLADDGAAFEEFCREAIEGRESSKFAFTRGVSAALSAIAQFGAEIGLTREELSHVAVEDLLAVRTGMPGWDVAEFLRRRSEEGAARYELAQSVELPPLIASEGDFHGFERRHGEPNFVTSSRVSAPVAVLSEDAPPPADLAGRVVLITKADPGYDWLFAHRIAGLVTMYGGANSHMAIRAAELGLPAAIGVGEDLYEGLVRSAMIDLDCAHRQIRVVR